VPVEGQWLRARTPLSRRDKRLLAVTTGLAAIAASAAGAFYATHPSGRSDAGCIVVNVASTMGGAEVRNCGAAAHAFCRSQGRVDRAVAAACRKQGFAADVPQ
jgi:uncharacterized membrane protein